MFNASTFNASTFNASTVAVSLAISMGLASAGGCVAMNIPSQRLYDVDDGGGILGSWGGKTIDGHALPAGSSGDQSVHQIVGDQHVSPRDTLGNHHAGGNAVGCGDSHGGKIFFDEEFDDEFAVPDVDPVPWPRFHPIPTRPVFSPAPISGHGPY